ncbi:SBBP repeat-containing protein, partial [Desulfonatronum sp. SC1]|uniref:SBBP repeat-containing protein n=1 Tax=Desulfonatronum sp. SC1 TaxID=2109626 RepID=UPI000D42A506
ASSFAHHPVPHDRQTPGKSFGLNADRDDLLQFASGGHVIGFGKDSVYVAGLDRVLRVEFAGGHPVQPVAEDGGLSADGISSLGTVTYSGVWDGVDVVYRAAEGGILESFYYVDYTETGPAVDGIRLRYNRPVSLDEQGNLVTAFENGNMVESTPLAWQEVDGEKYFVDASFVLHGQQEVGFALGDCLPGVPVIIDPILSWNTFLGGNDGDDGHDIAIDSSNKVYVTGVSRSSWSEGAKSAFSGPTDAYVAKLNPSTGARIWHTFLGGNGSRVYGYGIAVLSSGIYVSGQSSDSWGSNPKRAFSGDWNTFVAKLDNNGGFQWHTFLGGGGSEEGSGIAVDSSGNVYVAGTCSVAWETNPAPERPYQGSSDAFVAMVNSYGVLQWHTFLGGILGDSGDGIALDGSGNVYVIGSSNASWGSPVRAHQGNGDAFIAKLNSSGVLQWNTFLGGSGVDDGRGIAVDTSGNVYVTGYSNASWGNPVRAHQGSGDAFIAKLNSSGVLQWNTFLGGSGWDEGAGIAVDGSGNVYATGPSFASWGSPLRAFQESGGDPDAFVARLRSSNGALVWHTFLGGGGHEYGSSIAVDTSGNMYVAGYSAESWGSPVRAYAGGYSDAFVVKLANPVVSTSPNPSSGGTTTGGRSYLYGSTATVRATANSGYAFVNWTEGNTVVSCDEQYSFTATRHRTLRANFSPVANRYDISGQINPANSGTVTGAGSYNHGASVIMTVLPKSGFALDEWIETWPEWTGYCVVSTDEQYTFPAIRNRDLTANLRPKALPGVLMLLLDE